MSARRNRLKAILVSMDMKSARGPLSAPTARGIDASLVILLRQPQVRTIPTDADDVESFLGNVRMDSSKLLVCDW